jgi:hypothetical protein
MIYFALYLLAFFKRSAKPGTTLAMMTAATTYFVKDFHGMTTIQIFRFP